MTRSRIDWQDLLLGLFLLAVAGGALFATRNLVFGSAADMGPGYMPRVIASGLGAFGLFFCVRGLRRAGPVIAPVQLRPILAVLGSVALFALTAQRFGLAVASVVTVVAAGLGTRDVRAREILPFAVALAVAAVFLFIKVLGLPVPVWPR